MSSQCYWPISTFQSPPELSGSSGWSSSLSGIWYNFLKVKTVRSFIWCFATKQSMLFLHFWQKQWLLTSHHTICIVFYLSCICSAFSSSSLQSKCLLVCSSILCPVVLSTNRPTALSSWHSALSLCIKDTSHHKAERCIVIVSFINTVTKFGGIKKISN